MVLSGTRDAHVVLVFVVCNPFQEPEQLRLKKRINAAVAQIEWLFHSYWKQTCVCVCACMFVCVHLFEGAFMCAPLINEAF